MANKGISFGRFLVVLAIACIASSMLLAFVWARVDEGHQLGQVIQIKLDWALHADNPAGKAEHTRFLNVYNVMARKGRWIYLADETMSITGWTLDSEVMSTADGFRHFSKRIDENPKVWFNYLALAVLKKNESKYSEALQYLEKAIACCPQIHHLYVHRGLVWKKMGDSGRALSDIDRAIKLQPFDSMNYYHRGWTHWSMGDLRSALADFDYSIALERENDLYYYSRAGMFMQLGDYRRAISDYNTCLILNRRRVPALSDRAFCFNKLKEYDKAIDDLHVCLNWAPNYQKAYNNLGIAWLGKGNTGKAIQCFTRALELGPTDHVAYTNRSIAWREKGELDKAIADISQAMRIRPRNPRALAQRGYIYYIKSDYVSAISDFDMSIKLDSVSFDSRTWYAWLLSTCPVDAIRDGQKAVELAQEACELSGWNDPYALRSLAAAYGEVGEFELAVSWLERGLRVLRSTTPNQSSEDFRAPLNSFQAKMPYRTAYKKMKETNKEDMHPF